MASADTPGVDDAAASGDGAATRNADDEEPLWTLAQAVARVDQLVAATSPSVCAQLTSLLATERLIRNHRCSQLQTVNEQLLFGKTYAEYVGNQTWSQLITLQRRVDELMQHMKHDPETMQVSITPVTPLSASTMTEPSSAHSAGAASATPVSVETPGGRVPSLFPDAPGA